MKQLLACTFALLMVACGSTITGEAEYAVSAQRNYDKGLDAMKREDWLAAVKYFQFIRSRFASTGSPYIALADLRLADAEFGAERFPEAIDGYKIFLKLHPTHEFAQNGYANFRIGEAYAKQIDEDSWLFPPGHEMDQTASEDAASELATFLKQHPDSPYKAKALTLLGTVKRQLAAHEWYVATYYWKNDRPMGTILRLRRLLDRYRSAGYDEEALWLLGQAYIVAKMPDRARLTWDELVAKHPTHTRAAQAKGELPRLPRAAPIP